MRRKPRYSIDEVGEFEWALFDEQSRGTPLTYFMFVSQINNGTLNHQLTLTMFDGAESATHEYPVFHRELYATKFYSSPETVRGFVLAVYECLVSIEIQNPVELAHVYGGTVNSDEVIVYPFRHAH